MSGINFNNERFNLSDNEFSIEVIDKKVIIRYWNPRTHIAEPIVEVSKGLLTLLWSGEQQEIHFYLTTRDGKGMIIYEIDSFETLDGVSSLVQYTNFAIVKSEDDAFLEFLKKYLLNLLFHFNDIKARYPILG